MLQGIASLNDEIRYKAAAAVVALANRAESAGKKDRDEAKGAKWTPAPFERRLSLDMAKLREAVAYYEIAESILPAAAADGYNRALLLETIGEWDAAIAAFLGMPGAKPDDLGVRRCQEKKAGTYNELAFMGFSPAQISAMDGEDDADDEPSEEATAMEAAMAGKSMEEQLAMVMAASRARQDTKAAPAAASAADPEEQAREQAAAAALTFVNHLLDRDYTAAKALLHPQEEGMGLDDLREGFESLFEGEAFPTSANVFDVRTDMPNLGKDGVAWIYVNIDSENAEAVSLIVARDGKGALRVREVEFGRP